MMRRIVMMVMGVMLAGMGAGATINDLMVTDYDTLGNATLTRASTAFLNGTSYSANTKRTKTVVLTSVPDVEYITSITCTNGVTVANPLIHCISGGYLWATDSAYDGLFKSADGITWTQVQSTTALTDTYRIHGSAAGDIFLCNADGGDNSVSLYKSANGADCTNASMPTAKLVYSAGAWSEYWGWHQAVNGTIVCSEYVSAGGSLKVWRSVDAGDTFTLEYTEAGSGILHSHALCKQETLGRWVVSWGDGGEKNKITYSDDDGDTWADLESQTEYHNQPTGWCEYGHATRLLYAADSEGCFGWYDCSTKEQQILYQKAFNGTSNAGAGHKYGWTIAKFNGVYYTCSEPSSPSIAVADRNAAIMVSPDAVNWQVYYQFPGNDIGPFDYTGIINEKVYFLYKNSDNVLRSARVSSPVFNTYTAVCIDPATTNLLTAGRSTGASGWYSSSSTLSHASGTGLEGTDYVDVSFTGNGAAAQFTSATAVSADTYYSFTAAFKANATQLEIFFQPYWYNASWGAPTSRLGDKRWLYAGRNNWEQVCLTTAATYTVDSVAATGVQFFLVGYSSGGSVIPSPTAYFIDCAQLEAGPPTRWHTGAATRAIDKLSITYNYPSKWVEHFAWAPTYALDYILSGMGNQYIRSWRKDANNYVEIYYNPTDRKIYYQATVGGTAGTAVGSTNTFTCFGDEPIRFLLRGYNNQFRLFISYSDDTVEELMPIAGFTGVTESRYSNDAQTAVASGMYLYSRLYDTLTVGPTMSASITAPNSLGSPLGNSVLGAN